MDKVAEGYRRCLDALWEERERKRIEEERKKKERIQKVLDRQNEKYNSYQLCTSEVIIKPKEAQIGENKADWSFMPEILPSDKDKLKWLLLQVLEVMKNHKPAILKCTEVIARIKEKMNGMESETA